MPGFKPDAAVKISLKHLVLGLLELKKASISQPDMHKGVLLSCISALALVRAGVVARATIPFITNLSETAFLHTITVEHGNECPVLKFIFGAVMSEDKERAMLVAYLAVILHELKRDMSKSSALQSFLLNLKHCRVSSSETTSQRSQQRSSERSTGRTSNPTAKRARGEQSGQAGSAQNVASCDGEIVALDSLQPNWKLASPYYFVGVLSGSDESVFVKVWREGDKRARRRDIEAEVRHLELAHQCGVPCPEVVDRLTSLTVGSGTDKYYRLVMQKLANDVVEHDDILPFAISLITAAMKLHDNTGILHCDIKPSNILWNCSTKTASFVDFGHAQEELNAKSYTGTVGFTAPEVLRDGKPHSRLTEAYSVGMTLL